MGLVATDGAYTTIPRLVVPFGLDHGSYQMLVVTDAVGQELEMEETNNITSTNTINVDFPPLPDLVVGTIQAPIEAVSGQQIPITWTITNQGDVDFSGSFSDRIFLSDDEAPLLR